MSRRETEFQAKLIDKLEGMFPGCVVVRCDPSYIQGFPDFLVLYNQIWAALEVKASPTAPYQPNQPYWVERLNNLSFSAFVYPENEQEILDALQYAFRLS